MSSIGGWLYIGNWSRSHCTTTPLRIDQSSGRNIIFQSCARPNDTYITSVCISASIKIQIGLGSLVRQVIIKALPLQDDKLMKKYPAWTCYTQRGLDWILTLGNRYRSRFRDKKHDVIPLVHNVENRYDKYTQIGRFTDPRRIRHESEKRREQRVSRTKAGSLPRIRIVGGAYCRSFPRRAPLLRLWFGPWHCHTLDR